MNTFYTSSVVRSRAFADQMKIDIDAKDQKWIILYTISLWSLIANSFLANGH